MDYKIKICLLIDIVVMDYKIKICLLIDIVVMDYRMKICLLIEMTAAIDNNLSVTKYDKISQYKDLETEIEKMWYVKSTTVPVIVGALGMIKKKADKHKNRIPGSSNLYEMQKIALC